MRRRGWYVTALVFLALLAGCGSALEDRATVSPVELGNASVPAGITADGVDAETLAETHATVLATTSYTVRVREVISYDGTVRRNATRYRRVAPGAERYVFRRTQRTNDFPSSSLAPELRYWYNGTVVFQRVGTGSSAQVDRYPAGPPGPLRDPTSHRGIARIFGAFELRPNRTLGDGPVRLSSLRLADAEMVPTPAFVGTPGNASLSAVVDGRGYVRNYRLAYTANASSVRGPVRVVRRVRFGGVDTTTVGRPTWVDDAVRAGP